MTLNHKLYEYILDNMLGAVLLLDEHLRLKYMNAAAESLLEMSAIRHEGTSIEHMFSENGGIPEGLLKAIKGKQRFTKRQTTLRLPIPSEIIVDYTVTPAQENLPYILMEIQPLDTAYKINQEKSLLSSQAISRSLVRGLAHEIKNPLGGLRGAAQLLQRQLHEPELKEYTDIIIREADRMRKLVDQLLGSNKSFFPQALNIHEILEHIRKLLLAETHAAITIHTDYDPSLPDIQGDRGQLIQAFLNVAKNALQALKPGTPGEITFRTRVQRKFTIDQIQHKLVVRIDIIDNGIGIPADIAENIFFPMVSGREGGTGLGLSISQSIITQHKGLIKFESQPGKTVFSVYLPLE